MRWLAAILFCSLLPACMSTKIALNPKWNPETKPAYVDYFDYYWLGFKGHNTVALEQVCMDQKPYGIQRIKSFEDGLISFVTLGIYTPVTVKIWCGD